MPVSYIQAADDLLLEIAHCPIVDHCLTPEGAAHPCATIVRNQSGSGCAFQEPEPWSGHLDGAVILFVSSNPSWSCEEEYPYSTWSNERVLDYFNNRFGGEKEWIRDGVRALKTDGTYWPTGTAFWQAVRNRAWEIVERQPIPAIDYALTEVVHCKSEREIGVAEALGPCADRYLRRTLELSAAQVLVVLGERAKEAICRIYQIAWPAAGTVAGPMQMGEQERLVTFLPHPNARMRRTFTQWPDTLKQIQDFLVPLK